MNDQFRQKIKEAGIDIYTGCFEKREKTSGGRSNEEEDESVSIEYVVEGRNLKDWPYKRIKECGTVGIELPQDVIALIQKFEKLAVTDPEKALKDAYALCDKADAAVEELKRILWLHKCSMYLKSNKTRVHTHDKIAWAIDIPRSKAARVYRCTSPGCEQLMVAVTHTEI
jgi:hypothetical protein